jgi:hypothetical protein
MDGAGDDRIGWTVDGLAAAILGGAVGACLLLLGAPLAGVIAASASGMVALAALRLVKPEPRRFRLPDFAVEQPAVSTEELLLTEVAEDELLLEDRLADAAPDSRVVQLFAASPLPTPGELQQRIAAHLASPPRLATDGGKVLELEVDAAAALRQSLQELRRSLA